MKIRFALPVAVAALFVFGTAPIASAKMVKKSHRAMTKGSGQQVKVGVGKGTASGGPSGGSTKGATGGGS